MSRPPAERRRPRPRRAALAEPLALSSGRGRWVVAATVLGSGIAMLDATVVGIALPSIGRDFHGGVGTLQWVVTGYSLTLAAFLLLGGVARRSLRPQAGLLHRRRLVRRSRPPCCGFAPSAGLLIAGRVVQGIGGALLTPASLAILQASFRPDDRARAIGAWSGLGGVAGGRRPARRAATCWPSAPGAGSSSSTCPWPRPSCVITARHVPESRDPTASGRVDTVGAAAGRRCSSPA